MLTYPTYADLMQSQIAMDFALGAAAGAWQTHLTG